LFVTCDPAHAFFDFAAEVSGRAVYAVFVHKSDRSVFD
jgi:hypothetical protein